jgi:hypothetical protein
MEILFNVSMLYGSHFGPSVKLLVALASTVIPGFSLLKIYDQDFYSLLDTYVSKWGFLFNEGGVGLCRHYICCTVVSA